MLAFSAANGVVGASVQALAAIRTKGFNKTHLGLSRQAFGIRAPHARHWTTLKEDYRSNPRPIMNGKTLNIGNYRTLRGNDFHHLILDRPLAVSNK